ncbi:hypothetical protein C2857_006867 [Epichloe festucae Fl1]|uniref:Uncharacterized protein n=1 Tax=Epichloe festucae (strain Fl1) TaxID=877507 RepID=A0A7S9KM01_EPIFF|nr:hypothetical protein C2857_006867 [Epichloe festucae Fl1]
MATQEPLIPLRQHQSRHPIERLSYQLLCETYESQYYSLTTTERSGFDDVLSYITLRASATSISQHAIIRCLLKCHRQPTIAEMELLMILYGATACSSRSFFEKYAQEHPNVLEPRFAGIIPQTHGTMGAIVKGLLPLPEISMDKIPYKAYRRRCHSQQEEHSDTVESPAAAAPDELIPVVPTGSSENGTEDITEPPEGTAVDITRGIDQVRLGNLESMIKNERDRIDDMFGMIKKTNDNMEKIMGENEQLRTQVKELSVQRDKDRAELAMRVNQAKRQEQINAEIIRMLGKQNSELMDID